MKTRITIIIIILIAILIYSLGSIYFSHDRQFGMNWGINIPSDFKEEYRIKTPTDFHGDGERYTIYNTKGSKLSFMGNFSVIKTKPTELFVQNVLRILDVPKEKRPAFNKPYCWWACNNEKDGSALVIIYSPDVGKMYFIEQLM